MKKLVLIDGNAIIHRAFHALPPLSTQDGQPTNAVYEFLDRLLNIALPRIRDFRGVSPDSFDQAGNYSLGIKEQSIFPEIDVDRVQRIQGMDIIMNIKTESKDESYELLKLFGMPFANKEK